MVAISSSLRTPSGALRRFDPRRDLVAVADLVERCFAETLDADGRRYIEQMHAAARNPAYLRWAAAIGDNAPMPLNGYVWVEDGHLIGNLSLVALRYQGHRCYLIANVAVDAAHRRRGIARSLTLTAIEHARRRGAGAWLQVRADNQPAVTLYRSLGFQERARRTTWENLSPIPALLPSEPGSQPVSMIPTRSSHWPAQRAWLAQLYPPTVSWHLPFERSALRCDSWGGLYRFISGTEVRHWSAAYRRRLVGVLTWQPLANHSDHLWPAVHPEAEELALPALLQHARLHIPSRRRLCIDYPAYRANAAFEAAGFQIHQTLIWMSLDC
jgi:ribosomal protein S18 acetylase RimI-like enzyme